MEMKFSAVKKVSLSQAVAEKILRSIQQGHFNIGDKLPPERKLCETLGVSRTSLREGISSLAHLGILETVAGSGVYVRNGSPGAVLKKRLESLRLDKNNVQKLMEFREGLESFMVELACQNATPEDISRLEEHIAGMAGSEHQGDSLSQEDVDFHRELAAASHNEFVMLVFESITPYISRWVQARQEIVDPDEVLELHRGMIAGIKQGDIEAARKAVKEHFQHMLTIVQIVED